MTGGGGKLEGQSKRHRGGKRGEEDRTFVVHEYGCGQLYGEVEVDAAATLLADLRVRVVLELPTRGLDVAGVASEVVPPLARGQLGKGVIRGLELALGVVDGVVVDLVGPPEEDAAEGDKDDADEEEGGQDGGGGEDRLPGFEALLLEGGICFTDSTSAYGFRQCTAVQSSRVGQCVGITARGRCKRD